jgi:hypothetical protein
LCGKEDLIFSSVQPYLNLYMVYVHVKSTVKTGGTKLERLPTLQLTLGVKVVASTKPKLDTDNGWKVTNFTLQT